MKPKSIVFLFLILKGISSLAPIDSAFEDNAIGEKPTQNSDTFGYGDEGFNFDTSLFDIGNEMEQRFNQNSTDIHSTFLSDESFIHNAVPELRAKDLDIDKFLTEFDRIDCSKFNGDKNDPMNVLCDPQLMNTALEPLGQYNSDHNDFYNYLKSQIYQPLAYDITKRENLSDMVLDSVNLNKKNSLFYGQPLTSNYNKFEESILKIFEDISGKTSDMEANKDVINELMISTLKRFHLYWNYLRYQNQFDKLKIDTKEVMKTIVRTYLMKRDFLNYVSKTLIKGIIQAYYRFIRAHKMVEVLNKYGPYLISAQIINRYKAVGDRIQNSNFNDIMIVKEISYLISLLQVYHILSYKQGIQDSTIMLNFKTEIILRIEREYENYVKFLPQESQQERIRQIKHYTAVLLLKFKHITFIMFQYHGIAQYANMPQMNYVKSSFAVKIYYEMLDNMLMLPKNCVNFLLLKSCVIHETTKNLRYITTKYNIKRSTYGWYFLQELSSMMKSLYSKANSQTWEQWGNFKSYYYSNLFSVMYTYKKLFQVMDMDSVDDLETQLGTIIDNGKKTNQLKPLNFALLDQLDKELYNEFLSIKADYNNYSPVEKDPTILNFLRIRIHKFLDNFTKEHKFDINEHFTQIVKNVEDSLDKWIKEIPGKSESVIAISTMNAHPEFQQLNFNMNNSQEGLQVPSNDNSAQSKPPQNNILNLQPGFAPAKPLPTQLGTIQANEPILQPAINMNNLIQQPVFQAAQPIVQVVQPITQILPNAQGLIENPIGSPADVNQNQQQANGLVVQNSPVIPDVNQESQIIPVVNNDNQIPPVVNQDNQVTPVESQENQVEPADIQGNQSINLGGENTEGQQGEISNQDGASNELSEANLAGTQAQRMRSLYGWNGNPLQRSIKHRKI